MNINVTYADVEQTSSTMVASQQDMESQLAQLTARITALTQSGFRTELASPRFQQFYEEWNTGARQVIEGLTGMSTYLRTVVARHQELDQTLSAGVG